MTDPVGISIIVVSRNRCDRLCQGLRRIIQDGRFRSQVSEVVVVDDASTDGTEAALRERFPEVTLVRLATRRGIPEARNQGARHATGDLLLFLDDDGLLADVDCLAELAAALRRGDALGAAALEVQDVEPDELVDRCASRTTSSVPSSRDPRHEHGDDIRLVPAYTFFGGAVLLKRAAFEAVGGYSPDLFYSHEEDDLSLRLWRAGFRVVACPEVRFLHERSDRPVWSVRWRKVFYYYRNRLIVQWRHLPGQHALRETLTTILGGLVRTIPSIYALACLAGAGAGLARIPYVLWRQRRPMSPEQYRAYRQWDDETSLRSRWKVLLRDLRAGERLDWI